MNRTLFTGIAACMLISFSGRADVIVSVQSLAIAPGGTSAFEVSLQNTGAAPVIIGAFTFGLTTTDADLSFTDAITATDDPYLFAGNSTFGPDIITSLAPAQSLTASDVALSMFNIPATGVTLAPGGIAGLGEVLFAVSPFASSSPAAILLDPAATSLSDDTGNPINIDSLNPGTIAIGSVPEPSTLVLLVAALTFLKIRLRNRLKFPV